MKTKIKYNKKYKKGKNKLTRKKMLKSYSSFVNEAIWEDDSEEDESDDDIEESGKFRFKK